MKRIKRVIKFILLWSWVISLPVVLLGGYWALKTNQRYDDFARRYGDSTGAILPPVNRFAEYEYGALKREIKTFATSSIAGEREFPVINITVPESELSKLNSHLPQSGFEFVEGTLETDDGSIDIEYRYRGDFPVHWAYQKKSIRVKTKKSELYNGIRSFNLQAPKFDMQVNNFLSYKLAEQMGLLVPRTELVSVTLNGKHIGTHIFVEQLEEMTLRNSLVMPGDIYRGEIVGKDKYLIAGYNGRNLFDTPGYWDKMSVNNHYDESDTFPLQEMIAQVNNPDFDASQEGLTEIIDMEAWGRFSAFESLTNTYHFDNAHNWRIYYDPWRQKLVPIVWDATGWMPNWRVEETEKAIAPQAMSSLHAKLFQNGDFIRARNDALVEFFEQDQDAEFIDFTNQTIDSIIAASMHDPYLRPTDDGVLADAATDMGKYIERLMAEGVDYTAPSSDSIEYANTESGIRLSVDGQALVQRVRIEYNEKVPSGLETSAIVSMRSSSNSEQESDLSGVTEVSGSEVTIDSQFLPNTILSDPGLMPHARARTLLYRRGDYDIVFSEDLGTPSSVSVDMGQGWQEIVEVDTVSRNPFVELYQPVDTPVDSTPQIWQDSKTISGILEIDSPVVVEAGTTVYLEESASVIFHNKLDVQGTADEPVRFVRADGQNVPWGAIGIQGRNADGSSLSHCVMDGGSGYMENLFEYSGMFSVHDVKDLTIDNCEFTNGTVVDDMVHVVYTSMELTNSVFDTSLSDALDIDISEAVLDNVTFKNSGNDAVDLMSSQASITNSTLVDSGDKGISVGEGSQLLAVNNVLERNVIGVQIKDGSKAFIYNQTIADNEQAVDAYKKNWRYNGGGVAYINKSTLSSNNSALTSDDDSHIVMFDSFIDNPETQDNDVSIFDSDGKSLSEAAFEDVLLPENLNFTEEDASILDSFDTAALALRDSTSRGAN